MVSRAFVAAAALAGAVSAVPHGPPARASPPPPAKAAPSPAANPLGGLLSSLGGANSVLGDFASLLAAGDVKNGPAPSGCSDYEIIVGRGTGEPGPFGAVVGDAIVASVTKDIPGARGYAVQYPASIDVLRSSGTGADDIINRLNGQSKACPKQKFALVGYSQGAGIFHEAFGPAPHKPYPGSANPRPLIDPAVLPKIVALAMFGDPGLKNGQGNDFISAPAFPPELQAKLRENCHVGDPVCDPNGAGFENHVMYLQNPWQNETVAFIEAGFRGQPLPPAPKTYQEAGLTAAKNGGAGILGGILGGGALNGLLGALGSPKGAAPAPKGVAPPVPAAAAMAGMPMMPKYTNATKPASAMAGMPMVQKPANATKPAAGVQM